MSQLTGLFVLSVLMFDRRDDKEILHLAVSAAGSLVRCRVVATSLCEDGGQPRAPDGTLLDRQDLAQRLAELGSADGPVDGGPTPWIRAYALRGIGGHAGHLVVGADRELDEQEEFLLRTLAQQAGAALTNAALHRRERETATELGRVNDDLAVVNERLNATVADLERRRQIHETLMAVAVSGGGEQGIATAVSDLTGLPVTVEDQFGNVRAWAGGSRPAGTRSSPRRDDMLARARRAGRPLRHRDQVIALAQPRQEVLGVLALTDPHRRTGEHELVALEEGALVLAMELAHLRALAETELRLRRDLADDLLTGTDDESARSRAAALGHDLIGPHHVLLVDWAQAREDALVRAVEQAATRVLGTPPLLARRRAGLVAIVARPVAWADRHRWGVLRDELTRQLQGYSGSIGVGGAFTAPSEASRSYGEAERALRIRQGSAASAGVTVHDELGIYRLLAAGDQAETEQFVREWLGPLLDYDAAHRTGLVGTLWQYYECGGNYDQTAEALFICRSTVRYRLRRIRQLTGLDLGDVDQRLNLHVATRAWQVLHGSSGRAPGRRSGRPARGPAPMRVARSPSSRDRRSACPHRAATSCPTGRRGCSWPTRGSCRRGNCR
jgi:sugar diacid utilization regulator